MTPLINEAYSRAASIATIVNGFRATWPVDRSVFTDSDFVPSEAILGDNASEEPNHQGVDGTFVPERHLRSRSGPLLCSDKLDVYVQEVLPVPKCTDAASILRVSTNINWYSPHESHHKSNELYVSKFVDEHTRNYSLS